VRQRFFHNALVGETERRNRWEDVGQMVFLVRQMFFWHSLPLGTWRIPRTTPYILHGYEKALAAALPENLKLIPLKLIPQK
jgi:hypothetical protein